MKSDVVYFILLLLNREGTVLIPGVGRISLVTRPARLNESVDVIMPPFNSARFEQTGSGQGNALIQYLSYQLGVDKKKAGRLVDSFGSDLLGKVRESGHCKVEHLGKFVKSGENLLFIPEADAMNAMYFGLVPIALKWRESTSPGSVPAVIPPLADRSDLPQTATTRSESRSSEGQPGVESTGKDGIDMQYRQSPAQSTTGQTEAGSRRALWIVPLALLAVIVAGVLAYTQYRQRSSMVYPPEAYNRAPVVDSSHSRDTIRKYSVPEEHYDQGIAAENRADSMTYNDGSEGTVGELITSGETGDEAFSGRDASKSDRYCCVVVGAFGVASNVDRMIDRLNAMGLDVVTMPRGALTQVGARGDCGSEDIESLLIRLQEEVEADAWIYTPE